MISVFRNFAKSKWAAGLLVLVGLSLLITGGTQMDVLGSLQAPRVVTAGERSMGPAEFRAEFDRILDQQQQQAGRAIPFEELIADGRLVAWLKGKRDELGFSAWAWNVGIRPGNELVLREIRKIPAFFNPVTNQFDENAYKAKLVEAKLTPAQAEQGFRDQYIQVHFGSAMAAGIKLPRIYGAVIANQTRQTRDGRWFVLTQAMAGTAAQPTDAQLTAFMSQHAAELRRPEFRAASRIVFDNAGEAIAISEEKIQARFDFRKDALSLPERRTYTTLTAPNRAAADRIAAALRAGQTPAAVGQANNLQPSQYEDTARSAVSDPAVAAAVFGLSPDEVSAPIQARVGFVVAKLTSIAPGREITLADVRDEIVAELQGQEARALVSRRVEAYEAARSQGKSLEEAVRAAGAQIVPLPVVSRDGRDRAGQPAEVPAVMLEAMWKLTKGRASEVTGAGPGQYFVVRVDDVIPAAMPAVADVREDVTRAWIARENARLLSARSEALVARLRRGEDIAAVAASVGATVTTRAGVQQSEAAAQELGQGVVLGLFTAERGQPFSRPQSNDSIAIGRVDRIIAPSPALAVEDAEQWRGRLVGQTGQAFFQSAVEAASARMKASYDEALARQSLGLAPTPPPASPAQPAKR